MNKLQDISNHCVGCGCDTSFGLGDFVNRIPADDGTHVGYLCANCQCVKCDRCGQMVMEYWTEVGGEMIAGNCVVCDDCLTPEELKIEEEYDED